jgi:hypothetical protein
VTRETCFLSDFLWPILRGPEGQVRVRSVCGAIRREEDPRSAETEDAVLSPKDGAPVPTPRGTSGPWP